MRVQKEATDDAAGVTVGTVFAGGAADKAGVKSGDRLLTLDGRWTDSVADCYRAAERVHPGQHVELVVRRAAHDIKLTVNPATGF
jgi:S1-C subfamily serine protease